MLRIGEFSKITQVSVRMLRYYDENQLLLPEKVDINTGYRMYSAKQIEQLNRIVFLKELGFSVKKIRELLKEWEPDRIAYELELKKTEILQNIQIEHEKLLRLQASLQDIHKEKLHLNTRVTIKKLASCQVMSIRRKLPDYFSESVLWKELSEKLPMTEAMSCFSIYHDVNYKEKDVDIEACIVYDGKYQLKRDDIIFRQLKEVESAACFMVYGPYKNISLAYQEFGFWLEQHPEYRMYGQNRQICHVSQWNTNKPEEYVTELQVPIEICI